MKKYILLKSIIDGAKAGTEFFYEKTDGGDSFQVGLNEKGLRKIPDLARMIGIDNKERFKEIEQEIESKFKIGQMVVICHKLQPGVIISIIEDNEDFLYIVGLSTYQEHQLRKPTDEEIKKYFNKNNIGK